MRKILLIPDVDNWAWGIKARAIKKNLSNLFHIDIAYQAKGTPKFKINMLKKYDHIHFFDWRYAGKFLEYSNKISTSIASIEFIIKEKSGELYKSILPFIKIVAVSEEIAQVLEKHKLGSKVYRCFNGVNHELFKPKPEIRKLYSNKFRIGLMCKPPAKFDVHGYLLMEKLKTELDKNNEIECDFIIANYKTAKRTHEQMVEYYNSLDLFIHTGRYHLSTPNPYFEAASCAIATVGTTNGCIPLITNNFNNGLMIDIHKSDDEKIQEFLDIINYLKLDKKLKHHYIKNNIIGTKYKDLCVEFGENNRKEILMNWTWEKRALDWISLFYID